MFEILTPSGFQKFEGVNRYWHEKCLKFTLSNGKTLKTAFNHRFIIQGLEVFSKDIIEGQSIAKNIEVQFIETLQEPQYFYDPINVDNGSVFCHDEGLISHNSFLGSGSTLISGDKLLNMSAKNPIYTQGSMNIYEKPIESHNYMVFVDVARGRGLDYSTFNIIDVTARPFKQVGVYRDNIISPLLFPDVIYKYATAYNEAYVIIESNDQGSVVCNGLYYEIEYENVFLESSVKSKDLGVNMTKKVKRIGCSNIKDLIEENKLEIVDHETIVELSCFESNGSSYEASKGNHDDLVMNLVMFGWFSVNPFFTELADVDVRLLLHGENIKMIEDAVVPFGFIDNGLDERIPGMAEEFIWDGTVPSSKFF